MKDVSGTARREAARMARDYCEGRLACREFLDRFSPSDDERISELVGLIECEPDRAGLFTLSDSWLKNRERILELIEKLERAAD